MQTRATACRIGFLLAFLILVLCSIDAGHVGRGTPWRAPTGIERVAGKPADPRLKSAYRFEKGGWVYVHLEGMPGQIGFQHGYLLATEIADAFEAIKLEDTHRAKKDWEFFRKAAHEMLWPKIDQEYQEELEGISEGLKARGVSMDIDDVVALNAFEELPNYYVPWYNSQHKVASAPHLVSPGNCSAFVATGSYTRNHKIVIAHNNWSDYLDGERWRIIFDIAPQHGHRILMDGFPGVITSDDDFGVNSSGLMVAETTITQFAGGIRMASRSSCAPARRSNMQLQLTTMCASCWMAITADTPTIGCWAITRPVKSPNSSWV